MHIEICGCFPLNKSENDSQQRKLHQSQIYILMRFSSPHLSLVFFFHFLLLSFLILSSVFFCPAFSSPTLLLPHLSSLFPSFIAGGLRHYQELSCSWIELILRNCLSSFSAEAQVLAFQSVPTGTPAALFSPGHCHLPGVHSLY